MVFLLGSGVLFKINPYSAAIFWNLPIIKIQSFIFRLYAIQFTISQNFIFNVRDRSEAEALPLFPHTYFTGGGTRQSWKNSLSYIYVYDFKVTILIINPGIIYNVSRIRFNAKELCHKAHQGEKDKHGHGRNVCDTNHIFCRIVSFELVQSRTSHL